MMDDLAVNLLSRFVWASVLLAGAGVLACVMLRLLHVKSPGIHATIWWVVLLHGLLLFHVTLAIPWYEPSGSVEVTSAIPVPLMPPQTLSDTAVEPMVRTPSGASKPAPVVSAIENPSAFRWPLFVSAVWLGGMLFVLAWWTWSYMAFLRACRSRPCDRRDWSQQWETLLKDVGVEESIPLHLGYGVGPALCWHPCGYRLVVPVRLWRRLSSEQRRCVMQHELAHYRRGDVWRLLFARLLALPHWFNPLAWHAVGAIELACEYACDDFAGQAERGCATDYAKTLLAIGESVNRPPAWMTVGGGGRLFKRILRVLSTSKAKDSGMKKALVFVVFLVATLAAVVRVELKAQEASQRADKSASTGARDSTEAARALARIRELAKPAPVPFEEIEAIAARTAGYHDAGPIYAEVAAIYHEHGSPLRTVAWVQAALRQPLAPMVRLRMYQYWSQAADRHCREQEAGGGAAQSLSVVWPTLLGLIEASRYRIPVEGLDAASPRKGPYDAYKSDKDDASWIIDNRDDLVDARDALARIIARENSAVDLAIKRGLLSEGFVEGATARQDTPRWLSEGRATASTFLIDYSKLWKDLPPVVDAMVGGEGTFEDIVEGVMHDPAGPQVDLERDLIRHLGQRTTLVTDYREPILGHGERMLLAVELTDPQLVALTVDKLLAKFPGLQHITEAGVKISTRETTEAGGVGKGAVCVAQGCLIISDLDLLIETLRRSRTTSVFPLGVIQRTLGKAQE
jgi:beta-lactamase regulating signal transducer with metallopeptidase domain